MNWFKDAGRISNLGDVNWVNKHIRSLKEIAGTLSFIRDSLQRNPSGARKILEDMVSNKKISSFPKIVELLSMAEKKVLDNHQTSKKLIEDGIGFLYSEIKEIELERNRFLNNYEYPMSTTGTTMATEYAYLICKKCGSVKKTKIL